jgi:NAD(P)-dependent dehydrogenase (short-subunit alcohol dehydrogenase family)
VGTLDGKVCVVTGAAGVIGGETVSVLAREGAVVAAVDVNRRLRTLSVTQVPRPAAVATAAPTRVLQPGNGLVRAAFRRPLIR